MPEQSTMVGRGRELAALTRVAADSATGSIVLLGGDAGVGKTRLLQEVGVAARASGRRFLIGHCLDLGDAAVPYLPFCDLVGRLAQEEHELVSRLAKDWPLLGPLLPEYYRRDLPTDLPTDRAPFFDTVATALDEIAADRPTMIVVEDAHWADRSTRDLLTVLFTRPFTHPLSVVTSYRSDDLNRRHPLRPKLAEWARLPRMLRMALDPLPDDDMADLVAQLQPAMGAAQASRIVAMAAGNPFYAEELVAAGDLGARLPDDLTDLLLVRIDALSESTRALIRKAAVGGRAVSHDLLAEVAGLPPKALDEGLREAVENNVLHQTEDGRYSFRHALLAEAVYDDLLPGERVALHASFVTALRDRRGKGLAAALARHARACGDLTLALAASVDAGDEAMASHGPADAVRHYEDALATLAGHQRPGASRAGTGDDVRIDITQRAASAMLASGDPHRAVDLIRQMYPTITDPILRARLAALLVEGMLLSDQCSDAASYLDQSLTYLETQPTTSLLGRTLALKARFHIYQDRFEDAYEMANRACDIARQLPDTALMTDAMTTLARLDDFTGQPERSVTRLQELIEDAVANGDAAAELRGRHQLGLVLIRASRSAEAVEVFRTLVDRSLATGRPTDTFALEGRGYGAIQLYLLGQWPQAEALLDIRRLGVPTRAMSGFLAARMVLATGRGNYRHALAIYRDISMPTQDMFACIHALGAAIECLTAAGQLDAAVREYRLLDPFAEHAWGSAVFNGRLRLGTLLLAGVADAVSTGATATAGGESLADLASSLSADIDAVAQLGDGRHGAEFQAWLRRAEAERQRIAHAGLSSTQTVAAWRRCVDAFEYAGIPVEAARARLSLARELMGDGQHDQARGELARLTAVATRLGASGLIAQAADASNRLPPLGTGRRRTGPAGGSGTTPPLTHREREVLALVATGLTNGQIAKELFISTKTASVHVSNILAKLGVATRTQAAALVARGTLAADAGKPPGDSGNG